MANLTPAVFQIIRGTSETLNLSIYKVSGVPLDLTGNSSMSLYVGTSLNVTPTISKTLSVTSGYAVTDGRLTYAFVPADTSSVAPGDYVAEVHIVYGSGAEYRSEQPFSFQILERVKT